MIVAKMDIPFSLQGIIQGPLSESDCSSLGAILQKNYRKLPFHGDSAISKSVF